jgi:hypothetical protein
MHYLNCFLSVKAINHWYLSAEVSRKLSDDNAYRPI